MTITRSDVDRGKVDFSDVVAGGKLSPVHPGDILRHEFLVPLGLTVYRLAQALRVPRPRLNDIVLGRRRVTTDTALRLARYFGTTAEFWNPIQLTSALTRFPGVTTLPDPRMPGRGFLALRRMGTTCIPTVYLDGVRIGGGRDPAGIDDIVNPGVVAGVEVYRNTAGIPPQYWGTGSSCGVVLIWLRRGG